MAEKYGVIPKRFSAAWFDYVWTYYKWHILIPLGVIVFVLFTIYQATHRPQYDTDVIYAGHKVFSAAQMKAIPKGMAELCSDVNGDGETTVSFQQINFSDEPGREEMNYNLQMKLDLQFQRNKAYLYMFDKEETDLMIGREETEKIYLSVDEWAKDMPSEDKLYTKDGVAYAVSLAGNETVKNLGINTDDLYLVLRLNYSSDDLDAKKYDNAIALANSLIGE